MFSPVEKMTINRLLHFFTLLLSFVLPYLDVQANGLPSLQDVVNSSKKKNRLDAVKLKEIPGMLGPEYDAVYPTYMKYCSTTKFHPHKGKGVEGTIAGHGLYYIKGVCKDRALGPSGLRLCPSESDFSDPELGVGISVNKGLKNVNFLVIPGLRLFLGGNIYEPETFDFDVKDRIIDELLAEEVFRGIEFHDQMIPESVLPGDREEFIARYVFGSDYAVAVARNLFCINIPLNQGALGQVVDFLNGLNEGHKHSLGQKYRGIVGTDTKKDSDYHWNAVYDNCVHPAWNALAGLGLLPPRSVNKPLWKQIWNVTIPANTLLDIHRNANTGRIDVDAYYKDPTKRRTFRELGWISQQPGFLVEAIKLLSPNELFKSDDRMFIFPSLLEHRYKLLANLWQDRNFSYYGTGSEGLAPNRNYFYEKYQEGLAIALARQASKGYQRKATLAQGSVLSELSREIAEVKASLVGGTDTRQEDLRRRLLALTEQWSTHQAAKEYVEFVEQFVVYLRETIASLASENTKI